MTTLTAAAKKIRAKRAPTDLRDLHARGRSVHR